MSLSCYFCQADGHQTLQEKRKQSKRTDVAWGGDTGAITASMLLLKMANVWKRATTQRYDSCMHTTRLRNLWNSSISNFKSDYIQLISAICWFYFLFRTLRRSRSHHKVCFAAQTTQSLRRQYVRLVYHYWSRDHRTCWLLLLITDHLFDYKQRNHWSMNLHAFCLWRA